MAGSLPDILVRHGVADQPSHGDVTALEDSIVRVRADADYRRADVSRRPKATHGFRAEDMHACKAAAGKLIKYASGSLPRDPKTPARQREKITNQLNGPRIILLAMYGLTNVADIAYRIEQGTESIEDLEHLVRAINRLVEHDIEARGRRDGPHRRIVSGALDVWLGAGRTTGERQRAPLVALIRELFELAGDAATPKSAAGANGVDLRAVLDARIREMLAEAEAARRRMADETVVQNS